MKIQFKGRTIDLLPRIKRYVNAVERRLRLPYRLRARVMSDFATSIAARQEAGETVEQIIESLGSPKAAAAELNEQLRAYQYRKSPWRFVCLALAILAGLWLIGQLAASHILAQSLGVIGGADGPTAIFVTYAPLAGQWRTVAAALLAILGIFGYWRLCRCKQKTQPHSEE